MEKEKIVTTNRGKLEIWQHESNPYDASAEQKFGTRLSDRVTFAKVIKVHSCAEALEVYISGLNNTLPAE
jgi:hypothetical protein